MINYWWVTRPKRRLNSIPETLAVFSEISLDQEWEGQRTAHLTLEEALEQANLKRVGERRDRTGGGARTYRAWVASLGLIFIQESTQKLKLTLAGEAIMEGDSPVEIIKHQVLKYQFPSPFSLSRGVKISERFKVRPFRFLLKLLADDRILYLTEEEIAKIIITEAENETDNCYEYIVKRILEFRNFGDSCLDGDFFGKYAPSRGTVNPDHPFSHLLDIANTIINWIEYTQLAKRDDEKKIRIIDDKIDEVQSIVCITPAFIDRPEQQEYFQRKYGLDPKHKKDTRNLTKTKTITAKMIAEQKIKQAFIGESLKSPIGKISIDLIDKIADQTGIEGSVVEEILLRLYPHGAIGSFMTEYFEMAFKGRDEATEFEKATVELFKSVFSFESQHVGPIGLTPDVYILSHESRYVGIIDNKAYSKYTISNDHRNRMIHNYIKTYSAESYPLAFFSYIAGGFGKNITSQIKDIVDETSVHGSAMSVSNMIKMVETHQRKKYSHEEIRNIFSVDRQILLSDL
ncbi:MAG: restriction endonuclease FokI C-terminal domain-containing protein [Lutispora sp.]|nr:restriction endonuclease FokI C-terminal domain-containing protein [Lutispora sp.]